MFLTRTLTRTSLRGLKPTSVTNNKPSSYLYLYQQLQVFSFTAASSAFTLAPSDPTHNKNSPLSRSSQIARHFSSSSANNTTTATATATATAATNMASQFKVRKVGAPNTLEHRIYIEKDGVPISPFHDIPLYANEQQTILNMVVEIPRWTNGKLEVCPELISAISFQATIKFCDPF
jgi:hypothetical protein